MWSAFVNCISELDCLCSLALIANEHNYIKPNILDQKKGQPAVFEIEQA